MADHFTQLHIQIIFAVKYRAALIQPDWEVELYKYITGIIQKRDHKMLAINGMPDHIHFFIGLNPKEAISNLVQETKKASDTFIKDNGFTKHNFQWQSGYGAFSYSHSAIDNVVKYILNQKEHHRKKSFKEEYLAFLKAFEIDYDDQYLFDWIL